MIELLKKLAEKDENALEAIQQLIPVVAEESESDQLRQQQKVLNQICKLQVKLGKRENAILQKDQQMQNFLQSIRQHVDQEKQRLKKETDQLREEIKEVKQQPQNLKSGKPVEETMEADLAEILGNDEEEKAQLKLQLDKANKEQMQMKQQVVYMQQQMELFMQNYQTTKGAMTALHQNELPPNTPEQPLKKPGHGFAESTPGMGLVKDARAPFGVRPQSHAARDAASPYAPVKGVEGGMD